MKRSYSILFTIVAMFAVTTNCYCENNKGAAEELMSKIENGVKNHVIMLGHQDSPLYGHSWKYEENRSDVLEVVGDYPAVMGWEIGGLELGNSENLDGVAFDLIRTKIVQQHQRGGINSISWHTFNPLSGGDSWDHGESVVTTILEGGKNHNMFMGRMAVVANYLLTLKDENDDLVPIIFRPWHEHDGNWFWWGEKWCTHEEYRALWAMTYEYMNSRGLNNLVWCYMPGFEELEDKTPAVEQFDMLGIDAYQHKDDVNAYKDIITKKLNLLKEYKEKYNKPIAITETGSEGLPIDNWFTDVVAPLIENQPISYVLFWRNAWDKESHFYCTYKGHSSEDDFRKFVEMPNIITVKEVGNYTTK